MSLRLCIKTNALLSSCNRINSWSSAVDERKSRSVQTFIKINSIEITFEDFSSFLSPRIYWTAFDCFPKWMEESKTFNRSLKRTFGLWIFLQQPLCCLRSNLNFISAINLDKRFCQRRATRKIEGNFKLFWNRDGEIKYFLSSCDFSRENME